MSRNLLVLGTVLALLADVAHAGRPGDVVQQKAASADVEALLRECHGRQIERWAGVTHYVVDQSMMGNRVTSAYERFEAPGSDGKMYPAFRPMRNDSPFSSPQLEMFGKAAERTGAGLADEMAKSGFPAGVLGGAGADPWVSTDPRVMMGGYSTFMSAAAEAQVQNERERQAAVAEASESIGEMAEIARHFRLVGTEKVGDRSARHLSARGLQRLQSGEGDARFLIEDADLWIDSKECVPLRLTMAGTLTAQGQSRPMTLERIDADYRKVARSSMYEPFKQVMRMKGVMTAEQEREMAKAQAQLAEMEKSMAQLPASQREMILQRMGPQMAAMKSMASGGAFDVAIEVHAILVNPDTAALQNLRGSAAGVAAMPGAAAALSKAEAVPSPAPVAAPATTETSQRARQACLEEEIRKKQEAQKKKQGMGRLLGAVGRVAGQYGGTQVARATNEAATAQATADELAAAARDLGVTEHDIDSCRNAF
jgi:hypothetical protein